MKENDEPTGDWLETYTNKAFYFSDPRPEMVCLPDIAHALAHTCRFNGHTKRFYSVAEHCVLVSHYVPLHRAAEGLLHDAAEAYYGDIPRPLKQALWVANEPVPYGEEPGATLHRFRDLEGVLLKIIFDKYGLKWPEPAEVKRIDNELLVTEYLTLINEDLPPGLVGVPELKLDKHAIVGHLPSVAKKQFLDRAEVLGIGTK